MLGLPGTAFIYQGEELGLPEDFDLAPEEIQDPNWQRSSHRFKGRDGCRVPLAWDASAPAFGFNQTGAAWLPQPSWFADYAADVQEHESDSALLMYRKAIALRRQWVGKDGEQGFQWAGDAANPRVLSWRLPSGMMVLANFSDDEPAPLPQGYTVVLSSDANKAGGSGDLDEAENVPVPACTTVWCVPDHASWAVHVNEVAELFR
ncbi:DUF3459 domain-containing protein [Bifidobacterium subtile]|jgi:alpha-glucosidase|uniref:alpha-amylase family glycosyl hydrolase n=1 Tax=Bifidobacterium subtile TaxID=77635 RepID=UPI002F3602FB